MMTMRSSARMTTPTSSSSSSSQVVSSSLNSRITNRNGARRMSGLQLVQSPQSLRKKLNQIENKRTSMDCRCQSLSRKQGLWLRGDNVKVPSYLDGSLAGDFGFDPLGLGADDARRAWYVEAELTHGRWAMAGVAGILFTEIFGVGGGVKWYETGAKDFGISPLSLLAIQLTTLGWLEITRLNKYNKNEILFDPLNYTSSSQVDSLKLKEVKNGRLAMIAFVGFAVQALVCKQGPIECAVSHVLDPFNNNILTNIPNVGTF